LQNEIKHEQDAFVCGILSPFMEGMARWHCTLPGIIELRGSFRIQE